MIIKDNQNMVLNLLQALYMLYKTWTKLKDKNIREHCIKYFIYNFVHDASPPFSPTWPPVAPSLAILLPDWATTKDENSGDWGEGQKCQNRLSQCVGRVQQQVWWKAMRRAMRITRDICGIKKQRHHPKKNKNRWEKHRKKEKLFSWK